MTFDEWWDSEDRFKLAHEDEKTQARAAWEAAYRIGYEAGIQSALDDD